MTDKHITANSNTPLYRRKKVLIPLLLITLITIASVWFWYIRIRGFVSTDDAYVDSNRVTISSKISGRIIRLAADEGSTVQGNQVLVYLDDTDLKAQEAQYKAMLEQSEQNATLAQINKEKSQADFNRAESLFKSGNLSQEQFEHAQKTLEAYQALHNIELAKVEVAKAQLNVIKTQLLNTVMTAPFDGVVAKKWAMAGDVVQPSQPIFSIYDVEHIWVTANLEETKLARIKLDDTVNIVVDAYPHHRFTGKVIQLGVNTASQFSLIPPNNASGNFTKVTQRVPIKISMEHRSLPGKPDAVPLLPGMSAVIRIKVN